MQWELVHSSVWDMLGENRGTALPDDDDDDVIAGGLCSYQISDKLIIYGRF